MHDSQTDSMVRRRRLGKALRGMRDACGLSLNDVHALGLSKGRLSRIENGKLAATEADLQRLMEVYSASRNGITDLTAQMQELDDREWWHSYRLDRLYAEFIAFEDEAAEEFEYHPTAVPGLLQTRDYARAIALGNSSPSALDKAETAAEVRILRQRVLTKTPPLRSVNFVTETALRLSVGGPTVMRAQLEHLLEISELPAVDIRILPFSAGEAAAHGSGVTLLAFDDEDSTSVVFLSTMLGLLVRDTSKDVSEVERQFRKLRSAALPHQQSFDLIRRILKEQP